MTHLKDLDPDVYQAAINELERGRKGLEMIASENYVSRAILQITGSVFTNKYSEGYVKKRYYGGNEYVDVVESLAIERAKKLFGANYVNVQPHAGSQANMETYFALLDLGDPILAMSLDHGGHLTHGHKVNFSGKFYRFSSYGVSENDHFLNMQEVHRVAKEVKPKLILAGFSAYSRDIDYKHFKEIADEIDAILMADIAHTAGLVAAKEVAVDPLKFCDVVTTTTHKTLRGPRGAMIMSQIEDYAKRVDKAVFPGMQGGPLDHVIAGKAVCFKEAMHPDFKLYAKQVIRNAKALAESLITNGAKISTGGTDNHLFLLDITIYGLGGKAAESLLDSVNIFTNKNMIPFDKRTPFDPSGIRIGTAALTTRGLKESDMTLIGDLIIKTLKSPSDSSVHARIKEDVANLCDKYPLYPDLQIL
ncbi:MAG: serine hydroxymethyltransferase [Candidatus Hodarchaeales archaeon]|jgi:glycine hydroxymethyltransferase